MPKGEIRHTILSVYDGSMYPDEAIRMLEGREHATAAELAAAREALEILARHGITIEPDDEGEWRGALVLHIDSDCGCFSEPVIHREDCALHAVLSTAPATAGPGQERADQ